jgi:hypothetical protein
MFFQKKCLFSIPIRTLCGLCVLQSLWAFYLGILAETPNPFPHGKGLCMLGWLCVLQSLAAYTPGIRAGAILLGLPPLDQARMLAVSRTKPLHDAVAQMADDLYGGYAPATPFLNNQEVYRQSELTLGVQRVH